MSTRSCWMRKHMLFSWTSNKRGDHWMRILKSRLLKWRKRKLNSLTWKEKSLNIRESGSSRNVIQKDVDGSFGNCSDLMKYGFDFNRFVDITTTQSLQSETGSLKTKSIYILEWMPHFVISRYGNGSGSKS